jgi:GDPmannose 4,6-dehydratase
VTALILGVGGQDGSYLAEQLIAAGDDVWGLVRRPTTAVVPGVRTAVGDLLDQPSLEAALRASRPDEVYNLAAVTAPGGAWGNPQPPLLADVTALGVVRLLDAVLRVRPDARVVHASSSAIYDPHRYGLYGIAKQFAHEAVIGYRNRLHVSNAVLYSHTSPRQDRRFLAPTICATLARIRAGSPERLRLTDILGRRDWGYAPDYVRALPLIARHPAPADYVIATGRVRSVRDFVDVALAEAGLTWDTAVDVDQGPVAPTEARADLTAVSALGWKPETRFGDMVRLMTEAAWTSPSL